MNKRKSLTIKQQEVLLFIDDYQKKNNVIPTLVEMASKFNVSIPAIQHRLSALTRKKVIMRENIYKLATDDCLLPVRKVELRKSEEPSAPSTNKLIKIL